MAVLDRIRLTGLSVLHGPGIPNRIAGAFHIEQNDFSTPLRAGERWKSRDELHADYEAIYLRFLEDLRARDPHALLIVWATDMARGEIESEAQKVVQQMKRRGDQLIAFLPVDGLTFGACDWHPSLADDQTIAGKLIHVIDAERPWGER